MRKDGTNASSPQRASRNVPKKDVEKGVKRPATASVKTAVKKRKTVNSLGTPSGISDIEQTSKRLDQKVKAKVKKRLVPSKTELKKVPPQSVRLKQMKAKKAVGQKLVKVKPKKVVIDKSGKKPVKVSQDKQKSNSDKTSKDIKSAKKPVDKMVKEQGKKSFDSSPERRASEVVSNVKIKVTKKPKLVKKIGKSGEKKTCIVSVKIIKKVVPSNVKKITKKVEKKNSKKSSGSEVPVKNTGEDKSETKKGIASRRKSLTTASVSQETSPSRSPSRDTSPLRSKVSQVKSKKPETKNVKAKSKEKLIDVKPKGKETEDCKVTLSDIKNGEIKDNTSGAEDTKKNKLKEDGKKIIHDDVKTVKFEIKEEPEEKEVKVSTKLPLSKIKFEADIKSEDIKSEQLLPAKTIEDCTNDSSTSDEIPLEFLKQKMNFEEETAFEKEDEINEESVGGSKKHGNETEPEKSTEESNKEKIKVNKSKKDETKGISSGNKSSKNDDSQSKKEATKKSVKKENPVKVKTAVKRKESIDDKIVKQKVAKLVKKSKLGEVKNRDLKNKALKDKSSSERSDSDQRSRRMRLFGFWSGPKRHRVASLNALAKVHCLYENESRSSLLEIESAMSSSSNTTQSSSKVQQKKQEPKKVETKVVKEIAVPESTNTRSLRTAPGLRGVGRHYDILNATSTTTSPSSSSDDGSDSGDDKKLVLQPSVKQKQQQRKKQQETDSSDEEEKQKKNIVSKQEETSGKKVKKRRKRHELIMDLKDMVVRKRMASLNASAILAASYSFEKRPSTKKDDNVESTDTKERKKKKKKPVESSPDMEMEDSSADEDVIVRSSNGSSSKQKVSVIVNQDTDVTITGVYVNSTTRSTHHEGFCSIAGMQYRISSTSHTQTEATAVATETVLHAEHPPPAHQNSSPSTAPPTLAPPCKSYTPLGALSNMQPPGHHHSQPCTQPPPRPQLSPLGRRHGCSSAFTAPPNYGPHQPPPPGPPGQPVPQDPAYIHGYYQPAGPLISHHHHHHATSSSSISSKLPPSGPAPSTLPTPTPPPSSAPHPTSESSDSEVIITATSGESNPPPLPYRYPPQPYPYPNYQYYPSPPATASLQYPTPSQNHFHQEVCYSGPPSYPPSYFHHKSGPYPPPSSYHRRYGPPPPQYYSQEFYSNPSNPSGNPPPPPNQQQMIVTAPGSTTSSAYPPPDSNYPPPPAPIVDPYPPPPPTYYPAYSAGPPCYSHSPPSRSLAFIEAAYQSCPCPMQSCPKNVHTGPLTGASKGSLKNPLPPVALALPLEPPGALGPPSPARGSAGMPPPPSPALATARNPSSGQWGDSPPSVKPSVDNKSETGLLAISKVLSESVLVADQDMNCIENTIVNLNIPKQENVKVEVEDTSYSLESFDVKNNRKRRKSIKCTSEVKKQNLEVISCPVEITEIKVQQCEIHDRLALPLEKIEKAVSSDSETPVEKQIPLSDNRATVPVKKQTKKRKSVESDINEPLTKVGKCVKKTKVQAGKKKCVKRDEIVTEENIEPTEVETNKPKVVVTSKVNNRRRSSSKVVERRKSSSSVREENSLIEDDQRIETAKKKPARGKKVQEKTKADHMLRSHACKERRNSKSSKGPCKTSTHAATKISDEGESEVETIFAVPAPKKTHPSPKWSNGWSWEGQPYKAKVFTTIDDCAVVRKCYPAMRHCQGDVIHPRDCVLLKSGPRKIDLPFVAKVASMWENPEDGEMMLSLLWYYRPEHTEQGRRMEDTPDEIFASRHKDINSVACIEDKCFVLTFNEYCRYRKNVRRLEEGLSVCGRVVPTLEGGTYPRSERQPFGQVAPDLVFFCRRVYDFRQKRILKNPC